MASRLWAQRHTSYTQAVTCGGKCMPRAYLYGKPQLRRLLKLPMQGPMYARMCAAFGSGHAAMHRSRMGFAGRSGFRLGGAR